MNSRPPHQPAVLRVLSAQSSGPRRDEKRLDTLSVNAAPDMDLVHALAARGYDVVARRAEVSP